MSDKANIVHRQLENKVAIVTGGASGIGEAICLEFALQGAMICIADINLEKAKTVIRKIEEFGGEVLASEVDISDYKSVIRTVTKTLERFGSIDILVNCAGWHQFLPVEEYSEGMWEKIRSINLDGPWNFCKAVMPELIKKRSGKIINIGSAAGILSIPKAAPYTIAKHGVIGLTRALAVDLAPYQINVNCICPSTIDTPLLREATKPEFIKGMLERIPLGRLGKLSDVSKSALFLASPDSDWITGVVLPVDGGLTCCIRAHHYE